MSHPAPKLNAAPAASPSWCRDAEGGAVLALRVQPRASKNAIGEALGNELKIRITAPPVDDAANQTLVEFLAEQLECPRGAVRIVRGHASRHKMVFVQGLPAAVLCSRLGSAT